MKILLFSVSPEKEEQANNQIIFDLKNFIQRQLPVTTPVIALDAFLNDPATHISNGHRPSEPIQLIVIGHGGKNQFHDLDSRALSKRFIESIHPLSYLKSTPIEISFFSCSIGLIQFHVQKNIHSGFILDVAAHVQKELNEQYGFCVSVTAFNNLSLPDEHITEHKIKLKLEENLQMSIKNHSFDSIDHFDQIYDINITSLTDENNISHFAVQSIVAKQSVRKQNKQWQSLENLNEKKKNILIDQLNLRSKITCEEKQLNKSRHSMYDSNVLFHFIQKENVLKNAYEWKKIELQELNIKLAVLNEKPNYLRKRLGTVFSKLCALFTHIDPSLSAFKKYALDPSIDQLNARKAYERTMQDAKNMMNTLEQEYPKTIESIRQSAHWDVPLLNTHNVPQHIQIIQKNLNFIISLYDILKNIHSSHDVLNECIHLHVQNNKSTCLFLSIWHEIKNKFYDDVPYFILSYCAFLAQEMNQFNFLMGTTIPSLIDQLRNAENTQNVSNKKISIDQEILKIKNDVVLLQNKIAKMQKEALWVKMDPMEKIQKQIDTKVNLFINFSNFIDKKLQDKDLMDTYIAIFLEKNVSFMIFFHQNIDQCANNVRKVIDLYMRHLESQITVNQQHLDSIKQYMDNNTQLQEIEALIQKEKINCHRLLCHIQTIPDPLKELNNIENNFLQFVKNPNILFKRSKTGCVNENFNSSVLLPHRTL